MMENSMRLRKGFTLAAVLAVPVVLAYGVYTIAGGTGQATADNQPDTPVTTASVAKNTSTVGPSGLPLPRFVSLKRNKVNVRRGPSSEHKIAWVFTRKSLPVEIVAEFEHWRRIRDSDGQEGWVYHSLLAGARTITVAPWRKDNRVKMYNAAAESGKIMANVDAGVVGRVEECNGAWCEVDISGYRGWIKQSLLWGVYPNETYKR